MSKYLFFDFKLVCFPRSSYNLLQNHLRRIQDEFWKNRICSTITVSAMLRVQQMCYSLSRQLQGSQLFVLGPVPLHVLCPTDIPGESSGYRDMLELSSTKTLSYRLSWSDIQINLGRCQREQGLSYLSGLRSCPYKYSMQTIQKRRHWSGFITGCICLRFDYHRPLFINIPMGKIPQDEGSYKAPYLTQSARFSPYFYNYNGSQDPRCKCDGCGSLRDRFHLYDGQSLSRFRTTLSNPSYRCIFCNSSKKQYMFPSSLFKPCGQDNRRSSRSNITLTGIKSKMAYPESLRRVSYHDTKKNKRFEFLTNNSAILAKTVADIYHSRWQVELFFKWIKQHLRIKSFFGTSPNAVKTQIWIALSVYLLVAIVKKKLNLSGSLHTILQILEVNLFEKKPIFQVVSDALKQESTDYNCN